MVLDRAQRAAFEHATSSRVASIVGPPGCGKSFAGSELARAILAATQETLLVVCYTNHALDQFLCHLLDRNEQRIVRIGGKSKEVRLEPYSLNKLKQTRKEDRDAPEKRRVWALHQEMEAVRTRLHERCDVLRSVDDMDWRKLKEFLLVEDPAAARQLSVPTEQQHGYQTVARGGQRMRDDYLWKAWQAGVHPPPPPFEDRQALPLWRLSRAGRQAKRAEWVKQLSAEIEAELIADRREFDQLDAELSAFDTISEQTVLREARVIAATTTGAAKYHSLIKSAKPGVLLLEEAGEVLEAHVISSLSSSIRHVIMIGDHQQLRPKVETYHLTAAAKTGYDLNVSLFERLIKGGMAHAVLETQHRMRPEISSIARHMTYPELRDHESVMGREDVRGLAKNVCFINHSHLENGEADDGLAFKSLSKVNEFEADMAVQVAQYLLLQGYRTDSIVVLTPYLGQLKILNERFKKHHITATVGERDMEDLLSISVEQPWLQQIDNSAKGIRTCTIDNYQGEEADLIITTLVRSNRQGQLGFLGKADAEQRVNVLCTRARLGMIFIGNADCFLNASPRSRLWTSLLGFLRERGEIVDGLPIKCQAHQEVCQPVETRTPVGLRQWCAQGAGCGRKCDGLLRCGHVCPLKCHSWPHDETIKCEQIVREMCPAGLHRIERACSSRALPRCDHEVIEHCTQGHPLVRRCGDTKGRQNCQTCARIEKEEREKVKREHQEMEKRAVQDCERILSEVRKMPPQLRKHDLLKHGADAVEYMQVVDRAERYAQSDHGSAIVVSRIEKVTNPLLEEKFLAAKLRLKSGVLEPKMQSLFHGTGPEGVEGIPKTGFRLPAWSEDNMFGQAVYFATDSSKSFQKIYTKDSGCLLLCDVLLGNSCQIAGLNTRHPLNGHVKKSSKGRLFLDMDKDKLREAGFDSVYASRGSRDKAGVQFDEMMVYDTDQAIPRYILHIGGRSERTLDWRAPSQRLNNGVTVRKIKEADVGVTDSKELEEFNKAVGHYMRLMGQSSRKVTQVDVYDSPNVEKTFQDKEADFQAKKVDTKRIWVFHGTAEDNIEKICCGGFRVAHGDQIKNGAAYGHGVYTATGPQTPMSYADRTGCGAVILSLALPGMTGQQEQADSWVPQSDWMIFKTGEQLCPKYVVRYM
jgi:hypothetical protein